MAVSELTNTAEKQTSKTSVYWLKTLSKKVIRSKKNIENLNKRWKCGCAMYGNLFLIE